MLMRIVMAVSLAAQALVLVDAQRGAIVRWELPNAPLTGFQIERDGQVIGTVKPGDSEIIRAYVAASMDPSKPDFQQAHLSMELLSLADASIASQLALSFEDRNVRSGSTVTYTIRTLNGAVYAVSAPTVIAPMPPPAPPALSGEVTRKGVALSWDAPAKEKNPAAAVAYEIKRAGVALTQSPVLGVDYIDPKPGVAEGIARYTINAVDIAGRRGPDSAPIEIFVPDYAALDAPTSVKTTIAPNAATITWTAPANANRKGWKIVRSQKQGAGGDLLTAQPLAAGTFVDKSGVPGSTYYYQISAVNRRDEEGLGLISEAVLFKGVPPPAPTALTSTLKTGRVILKWTSANVAGYQIERSLNGKEWTVLNSQVTAAPSYEDIYPAEAEGTFFYRVTAWSFDDQKSAPTPVLEVKLPDNNPPSRPVINSISGDEGKVTVRFSPSGGPNDASGFYVMRSLTPKTPGVIINDTPVTANAFTDSDVEAGTQYVYRVFAVDRAGNRSEPSDPAAVQVGEPPLPAPPVARARYDAKPFPRVIFEFPASPSPSVRYALERQDPSGDWLLILGPFPQETSSVMDAHPPNGTKANYRLVTIGSNGAPGPRSEPIQVEVP